MTGGFDLIPFGTTGPPTWPRRIIQPAPTP